MVSSAPSPQVTFAYVAPFVTYILLLELERAASVPPHISYPIRLVAVALVLLLASRRYIPIRPSLPVASVAIGAGVFVVWIAPDLLFHYRHHWLFENSLMGVPVSSISEVQRAPWLIAIRIVNSAALVPVLEELFWRSWLMRWLIHMDFLKVPLGQYSASAFWVVAVLFASEHGPYWEVGLAAGIVYNWWLVRTKNLADCILAHAVTNALLAAYVLLANQWQYWL